MVCIARKTFHCILYSCPYLYWILFLKSKENNTKFLTDLIKKKQIPNKKNIKTKYQISKSRVCQSSISPGGSKFAWHNWALGPSHSWGAEQLRIDIPGAHGCTWPYFLGRYRKRMLFKFFFFLVWALSPPQRWKCCGVIFL